jgi:hypothetical protein
MNELETEINIVKEKIRYYEAIDEATPQGVSIRPNLTTLYKLLDRLERRRKDNARSLK